MRTFISTTMKACSALLFIMISTLAFGQTEFISTWKTDNAGTSGDTEITIPVSDNGGTVTVNYNVDWDNDGTFDEFGLTGSVTHDFGVAGTYTIRIEGDFPWIFFNNGGDKLKLLDISQWGNIQWRFFNNSFNGCSNLDISATDAPNLSSWNGEFSQTFLNCSSLTGGLSNWPVTSVGNMGAMFSGCTNYNEDLSGWTTTGLTFMQSAFANSAFNGDITGWDVSNVENFSGTFMNNTAFNQDISGWTIRANKFMTFSNMFNGASSFNQNLSSWDVSWTWEASGMLSNTGMSTANYDATLLGWSGLTMVYTPPRVPFSAANVYYCDNTGRAALIAAGWPVGDGGAEITPPVPDAASLTDVNALCEVTSLTAPTATDACTGAVTGVHDATLPITTTTLVTWTYTDGNGNEATQTQNVNITDAIAPVADNASLSDINDVCSVTSLTAPTATDNCTGAVTGTHDATLPITTQGTTVVTWTYTDGNGNESTQTQNVIINDAAPVPDVANLATVNTEINVASVTAPTATDHCVGAVTGTPDVTFPITTLGTTTITWTYDDGNGNTPTQTQDVIINDMTAPVITLTGSANINVEVGSTYNDAGATASDNREGDMTASIVTANPVNTNVPDVYTITYNLTDEAGNLATEVTRTVTVEDTNPPVITLLGDASIEIEPGTSYTDAGATALDAFEGDLTASIVTTNPLDVNTSGVYTIQYNVSDAAGNVATEVTRTVIVLSEAAPALHFDGQIGNFDYISVPDAASLDFTSSYTFEAWVNFDQITVSTPGYGWRSLYTKSRYTESYGLMLYAPNGTLRFYHAGVGSGFTDYDWSGSLTANTWYHVAATLDGTNAKIYINGTEVVSTAAAGNLTPNNNVLKIGLSGADPYAFDGAMEEVRFWNTARTQAEIAANMSKELNGNEAGLVLYYNFNEGTVEADNSGIITVLDRSQEGNDGTLTGFALTGAQGNFVSGAASGVLPRTAQTITFGALADKTFGDADFSVSATTTSGLPITFSSSNMAVATVSGTTVTIVGAGTTNIIAHQAGDATYQATEAIQPLTVIPFATSISLNVPGTNPVYTGAGQGITPTANDINSNPTLALITEYSPAGAGTYSTTLPISAGVYDVRANLDPAETDYSAAEATGTFTIDQAELAVRGQSVNVEKNAGALPAITFEYRGFVNGEGTDGTTDVSGLAGVADVNTIVATAPGIDYTATGSSYDLEVNVGTAATTNYQFVADGTKGQATIIDSPPVITLLGNANETAGFGSTYVDAGATATDLADGDITASIVVNNPVDTSTPGNYTVTYDVTDSGGNSAVQVTRAVEVTNPPTISVTDTLKVQVEFGEMLVADLSVSNTGVGVLNWSATVSDSLGFGNPVAFTKENFASWQLPENQDRITDNVFITRGDTKSIFNARTESTSSNSVSPADTEWFRGGVNQATTFNPFHAMHGGNPGSLVGDTATIHLITDDEYHEIAFSSFSGGNTGGGFAYTRTPMHDYMSVSGSTSGTVSNAAAGIVQVAFDATNLKPGINYGTLTLQTNDPLNPTVNVVTELEVLAGAVFGLSTNYLADTLSNTETVPALQTFKITNTGSSALTWSASQDNRPWQLFNVNLSSLSGTVPVGGEETITVTFLPRANAVGYHEWPISFTTNDPNNTEILTIGLRSVGRLEVSVATDSILFDNTYVDRIAKQTRLIENSGNEIIELTNIASSNPAVTVPFDSTGITAFGALDLELTFQNSTPGTYKGNLTFDTNDPANPSFTIPYRVIALEPPVIGVTPTSITETFTVNDTVRTQVTVSNTGNSDLIWQMTTEGLLPAFTNPVQFIKAANADISLVANRDSIGINLQLARGGNNGLFNYVESTNYTSNSTTLRWSPKPSLESVDADYTDSFQSMKRSVGSSNWIGSTISLFLVAERRYFDLEIVAWGSGRSGGGGSVTYVRKEALKPFGASITQGVNDTIPAGGNSVFDVELYGGASIEGDFEGAYVITSNDPVNPELSFPINITVTGGTADISTTAAAVSTSAVVNQISDFELEVFNTGNATMNVTDVTVDEAAFGVTVSTFQIPAKGSYLLPLTFSPTLEQVYNGTLTITSDDPVNTAYDVALTGAGLPSASFEIPELIVYDTLAPGNSNSKTFAIKNLAAGELNWTFASVFFEKQDNANFQEEAAQDRISDKVWMTRGNTKPMFNILESDYYTINLNSVTWTDGLTSDLGDYDTYHDQIGDGSNMAGNTYGIYLVEEDRYFDLDFISWTQNNGGGGISYNRRETVPWLAFDNYSGAISGVGQTDLGVTFQADNLTGGDYEFSYEINSNDASNPVQTVTFKLHVTGTPDINVVLGSDSVRFNNRNVGHLAVTPITIQNLGDSTLNVTNVIFQNLAFGSEESAFTVPAGGSKELNITFNPIGEGFFNGSFAIISNDPDESTAIIGIRGTGVPEPVLAVDQTTLNLQITSGGLVSGDIQITNSALGTLDWKVESMHLVGKKDIAFAKADGASWLETGNYDEIATDIWLSREQSGKLINIYDELFNVSPNPIFKWANGPTDVLGIDPANYEFGMDDAFGSLKNLPGNTLSLFLEDHDRLFDVTFTKWSAGGGNWSQIPAGGFAYTRTEIPAWLSFGTGMGSLSAGASENLTISADAANLEAGTYSAIVALSSNAEGVGQEITVNLTVQGAPAIALDVATLDFGNAFVGELVTQEINITNEGNGPLNVSAIASDEAEFSANVNTAVIQAGETLPVEITFAPAAAQTYNGILTITSNDATNGTMDIALSGMGQTPAIIGVDKSSLFQTSFLGETATQTFTIENTGSESLSWSLDRVPEVVTFIKQNYADPALAENQDRISDVVWITRGNSRGIFNMAQEGQYNNNQDVSPLGTQWANKPTSEATFPSNYDSWAGEVSSPNQLPGSTWSLYVDDQQQFYDVEWLSWQSQGLGGGFGYTRTAIFNPDLLTAVNFSATSGVVAPGGSQVVTVTFNPSGDFTGTFELPLQIVSNDPANDRLDIPLSLSINGIVANYPIADQLKNPGFATSTIDITGLFSDATGDPLTITVTSSDEDIVTVSESADMLNILETGLSTGTAVISVTADDSKGTSETITFDFRINANPVLNQAISDQSFELNFGSSDISLASVFSDQDTQDVLTYSVSNTDNTVVTVSETNGILTLTEQGLGSTTVTVTATDDNGLQVDDSFEVTVNKVAQTITFEALTEQTYGDATFDLTATASSALAVTYVSSDETVATVSGSTVTIVGAGTTTFTASQSGDATYAAATEETQDLTIGKAALSVTADDQSKTYGAANPTLTVTYSGFQNGDDETALTTAPSASTTADETSAVGSYAITANGGVDDNYAFSYTDGTLTVNQATLSVTADDQSKTYGSANPSLTVTYSGFQNGEDETVLTTVPTASSTADETSAVGSYAITASGGVDDNYAFSYTDGILTVNQATLSVSADDQSKVYGAANPTFTLTYSGFQNGDDETVLTTVPTASTTATSTSSVGSYTITASGGEAGNYAFSYTDGTLTVDQATLNVTADDQSITYGEAIPTLSLTYSGFIGNDDETVLDTAPTASTTATTTSDAGAYSITVDGGVDNNYVFAYSEGSLTINKADQTITFDVLAEKTVGDAAFDLAATATSGLTITYTSSDETVATVSGSTVTILGAGTTTITASQAGDTNFTAAEDTPQTLTVNTGVQDQTITFEALENRTYGETFDLNATASSGLEVAYTSSDETVATISGSTVTILSVGTVTITASQSGDDSFTAAENVEKNLTIDPATLTVTADDQTKVYGEANPTLTLTYGGFQNGQDETVLTTVPTVTTVADVNSEVAVYAIEVAGGSAANYTLATANGTLTVTKAPLTITADDQTMTVGGVVPSLTTTIAGFVNGDTEADLDLLPAIATEVTSSSASGTYEITLTGGEDNNYEYTLINGTLTVETALGLVLEQSQIMIYPNPAVEKLFIDFPQSLSGEQIKVQLFDLEGRLLQSKEVEGYGIELDVRAVPTGIMILQMSANGEVIRKRVKKE